MVKENVLIVHGGAPTAVINASLYGAVTEARRYPQIGAVYGAIGGTGGVLRERFCDLNQVSEDRLPLLLSTPASAIGTSRDVLEAKDYERMIGIMKRHDIRYVLFNGGNGSMDTCGKLNRAGKDADISFVGIPKTIDNDISVTDHAPGYGSAARYMAQTVREIAQDIKAMPIHVSIVEAMGRNVGWIAAASALARDRDGDAPHLIYLPERPFYEEEFLEDVQRLHDQHGGVLVVASEGLKGEEGKPIVPPIFKVGRSVYYGDVSAYLASLVIKRLGIKARNEKPGISGRVSIPFQSIIDRDEAVLAGRMAMRAALEGETGVMVGLEREPGEGYSCVTRLIPIDEVMLHERTVPDRFINDRGNGVTEAFVRWCRPLIGGDLPEFISFI